LVSQAKRTDLHNNDLHSEKELLLRVSMGDEVAYSQLFRKYWPQVYGTGLRLTRSPEQAKDLAQEMFLKLWDNREKLPGIQKLDSFLYTSSRNLIMDHLKKKVLNITNIEFLIDYFRSDTISAQEKLEYQELEREISHAVNNLPGKVKEVFALSRYEGLTHDQIAERLGISPLSSKTYVVRALQEIKVYLSRNPRNILLMMALFSVGMGMD
jgi:RNA polymerase sigma-70 factor (family 1)